MRKLLLIMGMAVLFTAAGAAASASVTNQNSVSDIWNETEAQSTPFAVYDLTFPDSSFDPDTSNQSVNVSLSFGTSDWTYDNGTLSLYALDVPNGQQAGSYDGSFTVEHENGTLTEDITITVAPRPVHNIVVEQATTDLLTNSSGTLGQLVLENRGNTELTFDASATNPLTLDQTITLQPGTEARLGLTYAVPIGASIGGANSDITVSSEAGNYAKTITMAINDEIPPTINATASDVEATIPQQLRAEVDDNVGVANVSYRVFQKVMETRNETVTNEVERTVTGETYTNTTSFTLDTIGQGIVNGSVAIDQTVNGTTEDVSSFTVDTATGGVTIEDTPLNSTVNQTTTFTVDYNYTEMVEETVQEQVEVERERASGQMGKNKDGLWTAVFEDTDTMGEYFVEMTVTDADGNSITDTTSFNVIELDNIHLATAIEGSVVKKGEWSLNTNAFTLDHRSPVDITVKNFTFLNTDGKTADTSVQLIMPNGGNKGVNPGATVTVRQPGTYGLRVRSDTTGNYEFKVMFDPIDQHVTVPTQSMTGRFVTFNVPDDIQETWPGTSGMECMLQREQDIRDSIYSCTLNYTLPNVGEIDENPFPVPRTVWDERMDQKNQKIQELEQQNSSKQMDKYILYAIISLLIILFSFLMTLYPRMNFKPR